MTKPKSTPEEINLRDQVKKKVKGKQNKVADALGIRRATLSNYLTGKASMQADLVEKILNYEITKGE